MAKEIANTVIRDLDSRPGVGQDGILVEPDVSQASAQQSLITPMEALWLLWENRHRIFRGCVVGLVLFTLIAFLIPKKYTATVRLMPPDFSSGTLMSMLMPALGSQNTSGASGGSMMGLASQLLGMNSSSDLFVGVLQSRTVEDRLIDQFNLQDLYSTRYMEDTREKLEAVTEIKIDKKTGILNLSVEDKSPQRAAAMAQAYIEELNRTLSEVNTSAAHRERVFIEARLQQVRKDLDSSAKEFSLFASQNAAIDIPDQAKAMVEAAAGIQAQLIAAHSELSGLQQVYTDSNVRVRGAKARVAELQNQLEKFSGKDVDPVKDITLGKSQIYPSIRQLPLLGVRYLDLYRQNKINEAVFELLTKQYEVAKIQEAREVPSVQLLDPPVVPDKKSSPKRLLIMLGGLLFSFVVVAGSVIGPVVWGRMDRDDSRRVFAETVLARLRASTLDTRFAQRVRRFFSRRQRLHHSGTGLDG